MRKLFFVAILALLSQVGFAQTIQDNAVIPVSVTINSILRLNVTSGGNIQFVFNTMAQYNTGILGSALTTTDFNVASSRRYHVELAAEDATLIGVEGGNTMPLAVVRYTIPAATTAATTGTFTYANAGPYALVPLASAATILTNTAATGTTPDLCSIQWEAGTDPLNRASGHPSDVYVTNVYLTLIPG